MKRFLLASATAAGLVFAAPAFAQTLEPAQPPVTTPAPTPDAPDNEQISAAPEGAPAQPADAPALVSPAATPSPQAASDICAPRTMAVNFGRSNTLSRDNSNTIERAVDAASVCALQQVVIAQNSEGSAAARRESAVRALLVRQGVPEALITTAPATGAGGEQLEVRMTFAGVARASGTAARPAEAPQPAAPPQSGAQPDAESAAPDQGDAPRGDFKPPPDA